VRQINNAMTSLIDIIPLLDAAAMRSDLNPANAWRLDC
jgi:hypothetical protein